MIPVEELRAYLGLGPHDETDDAQLERWEREELALLQARTNRYFGPVTTLTDTITVPGRRYSTWATRDTGARGPSLLRLRAPVVSLTSVEAFTSGGLITGSGWTTPWTLADFEVGDHSLTLLNGYVFPYGYRVRVTYEGGYAEGEEPADVRGALKERVAHRYRSRVSSTPARVEQQGAIPPAAFADAVEAAWRRNPGL